MAKVIRLRNIKRALRVGPSDAVSYLISGRVRNFRRHRSLNFIHLVDGSSSEHLQLIVENNLLKKPELGSFLTCRGQMSPSRGPKQATEFKVNRVDYLGACDPDRYPLAEANKQDLADGWYRQHTHLRPRTSHFASLLRVRSELELSMHMILKQMDFFKVHVPILTANDSEASSDLFMVQRSKQLPVGPSSPGSGEEDDENSDSEGENSVEESVHAARKVASGTEATALAVARKRILTGGYFGDKEVFMITSAQLHLECLAASLSRVYCLGPAFRAESSLSRRHLCEFTMLETEESNVERLEPLMDRAESLVKFCATYLGEISEFKSDFASLLDKYSNNRVYEKLARSPYVRMTYDEAVRILHRLAQTSGGGSSDNSNNNVHYGCDINRQHERQLLEYCDNVPIFITNYPKSLKPFYMKACSEGARSDKVENFDLIAPIGGEICGGSLREDNLETLRANLRESAQGFEAKAPPRPPGEHEKDEAARRDPFAWYLELREFGSFPHGGFGIGFERLLQSMLGVKNIRDTIAFPRWRGECSM